MRSFTKRAVAVAAATAVGAGVFLAGATAIAATPAAPASAVSTIAHHDDYDYAKAEVVAFVTNRHGVKVGVKLKLRTGEIITLKVNANSVILKGGVKIKLSDLHIGAKVNVNLGVSINLLGIQIKIRGLLGVLVVL